MTRASGYNGRLLLNVTTLQYGPMFYRHYSINFHVDRSVSCSFTRAGPPLRYYTVEHPFFRVEVNELLIDGKSARWKSSVVWPGWKRVRPARRIAAKWANVSISYRKLKKLRQVKVDCKQLLLFEECITLKNHFGKRGSLGSHCKLYLGCNFSNGGQAYETTCVPELSTAMLDGEPHEIRELDRKVFRSNSTLVLKLFLEPRRPRPLTAQT